LLFLLLSGLPRVRFVAQNLEFHHWNNTSEKADIDYDTMAFQPDEETAERFDLVGTIFATYDASFEECSQLEQKICQGEPYL
jgi:hypothetical protein